MENKIQPIIEVKDFVREKISRRDDGRRQARKLITADKIYDIPATGIPSNSITQAMMTDNSVGKAELKYEVATVTISAGNPSGTATVTSGSIILGWYPQTNLDQIIDDISVSGTTLTITLAANATATTTIKVSLIKA